MRALLRAGKSCWNAVMLPVQVIGAISGTGRVVVRDAGAAPDAPLAVDLDLEHVLGDMPDKTYTFDR